MSIIAATSGVSAGPVSESLSQFKVTLVLVGLVVVGVIPLSAMLSVSLSGLLPMVTWLRQPQSIFQVWARVRLKIQRCQELQGARVSVSAVLTCEQLPTLL